MILSGTFPIQERSRAAAKKKIKTQHKTGEEKRENPRTLDNSYSAGGLEGEKK